MPTYFKGGECNKKFLLPTQHGSPQRVSLAVRFSAELAAWLLKQYSGNHRPQALSPAAVSFSEESLTTHQYLQLAHAGVPTAVEAVVDRLRPRVTKMAWFYARRTRGDADDLLQEAWIGLLEGLRELDVTIGEPEQYLLLRARWRVLDRIKHACARDARVESCAVPGEDSEDGAQAPSTDHTDHTLAALCTAEFSARLKPRQRDILRCLMHGLTWRETGATLGCTSANIAYHVRQIARAYEAWNCEAER